MLLFPSPLITQFTLFESSAAENMGHAIDTIQPVCAAVPAHGKTAGRGHPRSSLKRKENRNSGRTAQRTEVPCRSIRQPGDIRQKRSRNRFLNSADIFLPSRPFEPWINGIGPVPRHKDSPSGNHGSDNQRRAGSRRIAETEIHWLYTP